MTRQLVSLWLGAFLITLWPALEAHSAELPLRKTGLWEMKLARAGLSLPEMTMQHCTDETTDKDMATASSPCQANLLQARYPQTATGYVTDSVCSVAGVSVTSHSEITGDFNSAYTVNHRAQRHGPGRLPHDAVTTIEAKWLGACKPDQKPGDIVMPGGFKLNVKDAEKLKGLVPKYFPTSRRLRGEFENRARLEFRVRGAHRALFAFRTCRDSPSPNPLRNSGAREKSHRNPDRGAKAAHRAVAKRDVAAMRAGDVAGDRKAEAGAALVLVAGVIEPQERLEHFLAHALRNARTVVVDRDRQIAVVAVAGDRDRVGVPRRVGHKVGEAAFERRRLHRHGGQPMERDRAVWPLRSASPRSSSSARAMSVGCACSPLSPRAKAR